MHDEHNTPDADRQSPGDVQQSPWTQPKKSAVFEPQSARQRQLFAAIGTVSEKDQAWFEANPGRTLKLRATTSAEIANREIGDPMLIPPGWGWATMAYSPGGVRFRAFVGIPLDRQLECAGEQQCRELARIANMLPEQIARAGGQILKSFKQERSHPSAPHLDPVAAEKAAGEAPSPPNPDPGGSHE